MGHWNHRLVEHYNSTRKYDEDVLTVHEVYYDAAGKPHLLNHNAASPRTKQEAEWIVKAFTKPPVARVDDASVKSVADGFGIEYAVWEWLHEK